MGGYSMSDKSALVWVGYGGLGSGLRMKPDGEANVGRGDVDC